MENLIWLVVIGGMVLIALKVYDLFFKGAEGISNKKASVTSARQGLALI
ncbi:MAG: hypothetical protein WDZ75_02075 [Candidatus Paceibacterota bacterium]